MTEPAATAEMTDPPPTPPSAPQPPERRRSMTRSVTDRHISGVSSALAGLLGTTTTTARVIFVIATLFGGLGLIAYALLWLFVPDEQGRVLIRGGALDTTEAVLAAITTAIAAGIAASWTFEDTGFLVPLLVGVGVYLLGRRDDTDVPVQGAPPPPQAGPVPPAYGPPPSAPPPAGPPVDAGATIIGPPPPRTPRPPAFLGPLTVGVAALAAGVLAVLHAAGVIETRPSTVLSVVLGIVGAGLLVSAWVGRARGLIWLGMFLVPVVAISTAADRIDLRGGFGEKVVDPTSVAALQETYRLGAGDLQLDLTGLEPGPREELPEIRVDQGVGRLRVFVPETWDVTADVAVEFGEITVNEDGRVVETFDDTTGLDKVLVLEGDEGEPALDLDLEMFAGVVEVHRERR